MTGMPNSMDRSSGAVNPTTIPHSQPHINPHRKTGICIGLSACPISGILPVMNGSTMAIARYSAA